MRGGRCRIMKRLTAFIVAVSFCLISTGCGETISGAGKDISRMGRGVKTIFVKESND
jgi:predicted small secreted protein